MPAFIVSFFINLAIGLVLRAIAWALTDPPPPPEAGTMDDVTFPETREGKNAGIVWGFVWRHSTDSFHHWDGDFKTEPIKATAEKKS